MKQPTSASRRAAVHPEAVARSSHKTSHLSLAPIEYPGTSVILSRACYLPMTPIQCRNPRATQIDAGQVNGVGCQSK